MELKPEDFTSQEWKILKLSADSFTCKEIATQLSISEETVKKHRKNIIQKLGLNGKTAFRKFLHSIPSSQQTIIRWAESKIDNDESTPKIPPN